MDVCTDLGHSFLFTLSLQNNTQFLETTIRVQHRETSEYRVQRQNAAMQAARNLTDVPDMPRAPGKPAGPHGHGYTQGYPPFRGPNVGRTLYYPPYYVYPGMPMPSHGYFGPPSPQTATMMGPPGAAPCGPPSSTEAGQPYYPVPGVYNQQVHHSDVGFAIGCLSFSTSDFS
jgi:hypothetical protein